MPYTLAFEIVPLNWNRLHGDQIARIMAFLFRQFPGNLSSVNMNQNGITLAIRVLAHQAPPAADTVLLQDQVNALVEMLPAQCPCGCTADLAIGNCYREAAIPDRGHALALTDAEIDLVEQGNYISAIKAFRTRCGLSLGEAKESVDAYRRDLPPYHPSWIARWVK